MAKLALAYLVMKNIPHREWSFRIGWERNVIGRSREADIQIPARFPRTSRRHAEVWGDKYGMCVHDLGSRAGTTVNGLRVDQLSEARIVIGDTISIGGAELNVASRTEQPIHWQGVGPFDEEATPVSRDAGDFRCELIRQLTPTQTEVLLWISRGYEDPAEIAKQRHRSAATIQTEIAAIFQKLGVHSRSELMAWIKQAEVSDSTSHFI
jgi:DNA-binding CsgD family transcriptional regulator